MLKVIVYEKENTKKARLIIEFTHNGVVYKNWVVSWDLTICAEILKISVIELLEKPCGEYLVHCDCCDNYEKK